MELCIVCMWGSFCTTYASFFQCTLQNSEIFKKALIWNKAAATLTICLSEDLCIVSYINQTLCFRTKLFFSHLSYAYWYSLQMYERTHWCQEGNISCLKWQQNFLCFPNEHVLLFSRSLPPIKISYTTFDLILKHTFIIFDFESMSGV